MSWITVVWSMTAAACLTLAFIHLSIWARGRTRLAHLLFAILALAVTGMAALEVLMMRPETIEQFGRAQRWMHVPAFVGVVAMVWFVRTFLGTGRLWLAYTVCTLRLLSLIVNFSSGVNLNYREITGLRQLHLWGGETVAVADGVFNPWTRLGQLSLLLLVAYVLDAALAAWRRGDRDGRRRAAIVGGSFAFFVLASGIHYGMVLEQVISPPSLIAPVFLVIVLAMGYELGNDVFRADRLDRQLQISHGQLQESEQRFRAMADAAALQRDELAHLSRVAMLGELSGSLAHELNQPLTAILSNAQAAQRILGRGTGNIDEIREILKDIVEDDRRAGEVIKRLRTLFRKEEVRYRPLEVNEVVLDVLRMMRSDLLNRDVAVSTELAAGLPMVDGDPVQLQQVLVNLVMNGCDAMDGAPGDRRLALRTAAAHGGEIEVSVADRGRGIPLADLERIFEPFVSTKAEGMGLGLAVCRTIVAAHRGRLWAANNADRGANFHFTLPARREPG